MTDTQAKKWVHVQPRQVAGFVPIGYIAPATLLLSGYWHQAKDGLHSGCEMYSWLDPSNCMRVVHISFNRVIGGDTDGCSVLLMNDKQKAWQEDNDRRRAAEMAGGKAA